jgi:asparagine synthase (glutamine-hydrolysing)
MGKKEEELVDLEAVLFNAKEQFSIEGVVSGAIASNYQTERIKKICDKFGLECFNPLWGKNQIELLEELAQKDFNVLISAVAAFPLDKSWVGRRIDAKFINSVKKLEGDYGINPAGEGGEFESLVVDCPLFK